MAAADYFVEVGDPGSATTLDSNYTIADSTVTVVSTTNWPSTGKAVIFAIDTATVIDGKEVQTAGTYCEFEGTVASATSITNVDYKRGDGDQNFSAGSLTRVYIPVSAERENRLITGLTTEHAQDGTHTAITGTSATFTGNVTAGSFTESGTASNGWQVGLGDTPDTVTNNGNRSYDLVFNSTDHTDVISEGMRLRTTRTSAAPNQCADLESGSSQYFNSASPSGITFTSTFTATAWIKVESYGAVTILSKWDGADGFGVELDASGRLRIFGDGVGGLDDWKSYQSLPLGRWVHVAATMKAAATSTSTMYIDGVSVPVENIADAITAITQAGNLNIGSRNDGSSLFDGKIAQVGLFDAVIAEATIRDYMTHGLAGNETNCVGAWSLDNSLLDLNSNGNDLTAQGGALATDTDSPFGDGGTSTTLDYGIVTATSFSTNTTLTVQVPEGCTIPTSGGVSAVAYSTNSCPYGFVRNSGRWGVEVLVLTNIDTSGGVAGTVYNPGGMYTEVPIGDWVLWSDIAFQSTTSIGTTDMHIGLSSSNSSFLEMQYGVRHYETTAISIASATVLERLSVSAATKYYIVMQSNNTCSTFRIRGAVAASDAEHTLLRVTPAYL